jgi:hypothetical protein
MYLLRIHFSYASSFYPRSHCLQVSGAFQTRNNSALWPMGFQPIHPWLECLRVYVKFPVPLLRASLLLS